MKLRMFSFVLLLTLLIITVSGNATVENPEIVNTHIISGYASNEYIAVDGWGEGIGGFSETNDYTETWYDDGVSYYLSDSLLISMILIVQLPDVSTFDNITFHANWRFTASSSDTGYWCLGNSTGDIVGAHNNLYSYTGTDSGWEEVEVSLAIDADVIAAQNSTGHLSFIMTGAGGNTYEVYSDLAFLSLDYDYAFSQTIDGDTYFTPDPTQFLAIYGYGEGIGAITESNSYNETWSNDATVWRVGDDLAIYMILIVQLPDVSKFDNITFHANWRFTASSSDTGYWCLGNSTGDIVGAHNNLYSYTGTDSGWEEVEVSLAIDADVIAAQNSTGHLSFIITAAGANDYDIYCDFAFVSPERYYVDSFSDVSDWALRNCEADASLSSDGDVFTFETSVGASDSDSIRSNITEFDSNGRYVEHYLKTNVSCSLKFAIYNQALTLVLDTWTHSMTAGTWTSIKRLVETSQDAGWLYYTFDNQNKNIKLEGDYLRIAPPDEMGYSHDGSTITGITDDGEAGLTYTSSSNGEFLTLTAENTDGASHVAEFYIAWDSSTTDCEVERDYYPFLYLNYNASLEGGATYVNYRPYIDGYYAAHGLTEDSTWIELTVNTAAYSSSSGNNYIQFYSTLDTIGESFTLEIDTVRAYGIANHTLSQSSTTTSDYLYVSGGILHSNMSSGSIILDYDPPFLLTGSYSWNKSTSLGTSYLSFYHGGWKAYSGATTGDLVGGTTTDYRILFNGTANVIDIQYSAIPPQWYSFTMELIQVDMPNWNNFTLEEIEVFVPIGEVTVQYYLMFLGFILIPASTLYMAYGIKTREVSVYKLLIFLLAFFTGWALLLGGIYG